MRRFLFFISLIIFTPLIFLISLSLGPSNYGFSTVIAVLLSNGTPIGTTIIMEIRLPRIIASYIVGSSLGIAGASSQALFKNPLGDPYLLGISSGAAFGAVLGFMFFPKLIPLLAFIFSFITVLIVYIIAKNVDSSPKSLILAGVAIGFLLTAISQYFILYIPHLHAIYAWLLGSFSTVGWKSVYLLIPALAISILTFPLYKWLNLLLLSDEESHSLGLDVGVARTVIILIITILTSLSVAVAGIIGFVGLVVPHISRLLVGANHKYLLPSSLLFGGIFLMIADTIARIGSMEIPVGIITAIMGSPLFIYLLVRSRVKN